MAVRIIYFVHGTTTDSEWDLASGWRGRGAFGTWNSSSKRTRRSCCDNHFDIVFCSDLKRAVDFAKLGFSDKYKIIPDARLRGCNYRYFTGKPSADFKGDMTKYINKQFPSGESYKDVEKRMADFVSFLEQNYNGKHIAIVAHQAPQLALEGKNLGASD